MRILLVQILTILNLCSCGSVGVPKLTKKENQDFMKIKEAHKNYYGWYLTKVNRIQFQEFNWSGPAYGTCLDLKGNFGRTVIFNKKANLNNKQIIQLTNLCDLMNFHRFVHSLNLYL